MMLQKYLAGCGLGDVASQGHSVKVTIIHAPFTFLHLPQLPSLPVITIIFPLVKGGGDVAKVL